MAEISKSEKCYQEMMNMADASEKEMQDKFKELVAHLEEEYKEIEESERKKVDDSIKEYEESERKKADDSVKEYEESERKRVDEAVKEYEESERKKADDSVKEYEESERSRINEELAEYERVRMAEIDKAISDEKERILTVIRNNGFDVERAAEEEQYNKAVEEMPSIRSAFNEQMSAQLREVSRDFRTNTGNITNEMEKIVKKVAANVIEELQNSANEILKTVEISTDTAINSVVGIERSLKNDDFDDLLHAYCQLDKQVYYRRTKYGEDSEEFRQYWKGVAQYLKGFRRTLSKLGYEVFSAEIGTSPDENVEIDEDESVEYPENITEYSDFIIESIISSGIRHKEQDEYTIEIKPLVKVVKKQGD